MKGAGVATGISGGGRSPGVSAGRGASGATGKMGVSVSLSPEARPGVASTSFSSRNLSMFNRESLPGARKSMFNINRPIRPSSIVSHERKTPSILNVNRGREIKSNFARVKSLEPARRVFDLARPITRVDKIQSFPKPNRERVRTSAFKNTVILWERPKDTVPNKGNNRIETRSRINRKRQENRLPRVREIMRPYLKRKESTRAQIKPERRVKTNARFESQVKQVKRQEAHQTLKSRIQERVRVSNNAQTARALELDTRQGEKMIGLIAQVRRIPEYQAQRIIATSIAEKYKAKPGVEILPEKKEDAEEKEKVQVQPVILVEQKVKSQEKEDTDGKEKQKGRAASGGGYAGAREFYFKKNYEVNQSRVSKVIEAAKFLLRYTRKDVLPTGRDIAYQASIMESASDKSEVARPIPSDATFQDVLGEVAKIGTVSEGSQIYGILNSITDKMSAIRLSFVKDGEVASERDTEKVYRAPLDGQEAYFAENGNSYGVFKKDINGRVWFIPRVK